MVITNSELLNISSYAQEYLHYENENLYFEYPSNLIKNDNESDIVVFYFPSENGSYDMNENITVEVNQMGKVDLDTHSSLKVNYFKQKYNNNNFTILESKDINHPTLLKNLQNETFDYNGYHLVFTYGLDDTKWKTKQTWYFVEGKKYNITYSAKDENFDSHKNIAQNIQNTLEIFVKEYPLNQNNTYIPQLAVGTDPYAIAVNEYTNKTYISNLRHNTISVLDDYTKQLIKNIQVGIFPTSLTIDEGLNRIFVINSRSDSVSVIDGYNDTVIKNIPVGKRPIFAVNDELEARVDSIVFVSNSQSDTISVIDSTSNEIIDNITINGLKEPTAIAIDPIANKLYVVNYDSNANTGWVSVVDYFLTNDGKLNYKAVGNITVGSSPTDIAFDRYTNKIFVTNADTNTLYIVDLSLNSSSEPSKIKVGINPTNVAIDPSNKQAYVTNYLSDTLSIIDINKENVTKELQTGSYPETVYYNPISGYIYLINHGSKTISEINSTEYIVGVNYKIDPLNTGNHLNCMDQNITDMSFIKYNTNSTVQCVVDKSDESHFYSVLSKDYQVLSNNRNDDIFTFQVTDYGNITTKFTIPQPIILPEDFWNNLYTLIIPILIIPFAGWFIPQLGRMIIGNGQRKNMKYAMDLISRIYSESRNEYIVANLEDVRNYITGLLTDGKITDSQYNILNDKISFLIKTKEQ